MKQNLEQKIDENQNHILMGKALAESITHSIELVKQEVQKETTSKPIEHKLKKILKQVDLENKSNIKIQSEDDILEDSDEGDEGKTTIVYGRKGELNGMIYADSSPVSYSDVMYGHNKSQISSQEEGFYESKTKQEMELADTMNDEEAEITVKEVQYATVMGQQVEININARKRFSTWLTAGSNQHMLAYFEIVHGITRDVDYDVRH
ncbi:hypothetical protein COV12_02785 [Candidatus Woesearchaeota archaeon CG10_big_fil_rev_8_21_14_0_10_32_24]|nr:MAG: hypothetical protein COV12_02785 [Candidatus Woesearchaeota archaeon CG10_big_fil_rev_8_21_14_0_10_32_24]